MKIYKDRPYFDDSLIMMSRKANQIHIHTNFFLFNNFIFIGLSKVDEYFYGPKSIK